MYYLDEVDEIDATHVRAAYDVFAHLVQRAFDVAELVEEEAPAGFEISMHDRQRRDSPVRLVSSNGTVTSEVEPWPEVAIRLAPNSNGGSVNE